MTTTSIDLTPIIQLAVEFMAVVLPALAGYIAWILKQKMNIQQDSADAAIIDKAVSRAGGIAYSILAKAVGGPHSIEVRNEAVASGINHMVISVPDALKRLDVTPDTVQRMVQGEIGKLEANSPGPILQPFAHPPYTMTPTIGSDQLVEQHSETASVDPKATQGLFHHGYDDDNHHHFNRGDDG